MPDHDSEEEKDIDEYSVETKMNTAADFFWSLKHRNQNRSLVRPWNPGENG